jgi:L-fuconolactonase
VPPSGGPVATGSGSPAPSGRPRRVDAHHHVWDLTVRDQPWTAGLPALRRSFSLDDLRPRLRTNHVDRTVVVQTICVEEETPELLELADNAPEVAGVVGWTDLSAPDIADRLAALRQLQGGQYLVGVRHQVQEEPDPGWLGRDEVRHGLQAVGDAGLVYDLVVRHYQLPAVIETVAALGDVRFVLDHAGKPDIARGQIEPWRAQVGELARLPNVAVKLSGLVTEADHHAWTVDQIRPYAEVIIGAFGATRTMWGSDWPVCLLAASYDDVLATAESFVATMSVAEQGQVLGGTALAWYALEGVQSGLGHSGPASIGPDLSGGTQSQGA